MTRRFVLRRSKHALIHAQMLRCSVASPLLRPAGRYVASFLTVVILQAVWSETQRGGDEKQQQRHQSQPDVPLPYRSALSFLAVLSAAVALQLVAPYLGAFLVRQPDDVQPASLVLLRDSAPPCGPRWAWKTVKGCFVTSVVLGLCIAAAVLSGNFDPVCRRLLYHFSLPSFMLIYLGLRGCSSLLEAR